MNATRFAIVIAPLATRKPPTPSTTRNDTCSAMPAIGTTRAEIFATLMPAAQAPLASASTVAISRSVAFAARTVRMAPIDPLDGGGEVADLLLLLPAGGADAARQQHDRDDRHGDDEHREAEQQRVDDQHRDQRADEDHRAAERVDESLRDHGVEQRRVRADPRDQVARAALVELADRQAQHPAHQVPAGGEHDARAGALQQVVLHAAEQRRMPRRARRGSRRASRGRRPSRRSR